MAINSRTKGNKAERSVAKLMQQWTKKNFARTPSSGGLQWSNTNAKGDIVCTTEGHYFPFCIEVKSYSEIHFEHLLIPNKKQVKILDFWAQCLRDANLAKKLPLLFMRYNALPKDFYFVVMSKDILELFGISPKRALVINHVNLVVFTSPELIALNYKDIKQKAKKVLNETKRSK